MKRGTLRLILVAGIAALAFWGWHLWSPAPEAAIRNRLAELARAACVPVNEAPLAGVINAQQLADFFTADAQVTLDVPGHSRVTFGDREELLKAAIHGRSLVSGLKVDFLDIQVTVASDQHSATSHLTARAKIPGDGGFYVQELRLTLKKARNQWLVTRVEAVKTFSSARWDCGYLPGRAA